MPYSRKTHTITLLILSVLILFALGTAHARLGWMDGPGNLKGVNLQGQVIPIAGEIWMPRVGWGTTAKSGNVWRVKNVTYSRSGEEATWRGLVNEGDVAFTYEQKVTETGGQLVVSISVVAQTDAPTEGLFYFFHLPVSLFAGGPCRLQLGNQVAGQVTLPPVQPANPRLFSASANRLVIGDAAGNLEFDVLFNRTLTGSVQDDRYWGSPVYSMYVQFYAGTLPRWQTATLQFTVSLAGQPDTTPANINVDSRGTGKRFGGWGGNFVYGLECPDSQFLLDNTRVAFARTGMSLDLWEPVNDDGSPLTTNWANTTSLGSQVKRGSYLEREFAIAGQVAARGTPLIMSAWHLPKWLHGAVAAEVPRNLWPELFENVTSYLLHAKQHYGAEPELFSFNEPDAGVDVKFTADNHRDFIKGMGQAFAVAGLRTKLLLADVTNPAVSTAYALPTVQDPDALSYVGALSVHSWAWSDYGPWEAGIRAWSELAGQIQKPFLVTEVGADASAWNFPWLFGSYQYAVEDLHNFLALLRSGRPLAALFWEYTCDYGLIRYQAGLPVPSQRFHFIRHFSDVTPAGAEHIAVTTDREDLLCAGFRIHRRDAVEYTIHVANLAAARSVRLRGLPRVVRTLQAVRTSETESLQLLPRIPAEDGEATIELTPQSLLTLVAVGEKHRR